MTMWWYFVAFGAWLVLAMLALAFFQALAGRRE